MMIFRNLLAGAACLGLAAVSPFAKAAHAYPIDCAILLCLAGGFPASAECSASKAEVIRRITPWPVEPPLQLWRCPLGSGGVNFSGETGSSGVAPAVAKYRDAIELWQLSKHVTYGSGGRDVHVGIARYGYSPTGDFIRFSVGSGEMPLWLDDEIRRRTGSTFNGEYGRGFRSIVLRVQDYTGAYSTEWVAY